MVFMVWFELQSAEKYSAEKMTEHSFSFESPDVEKEFPGLYSSRGAGDRECEYRTLLPPSGCLLSHRRASGPVSTSGPGKTDSAYSGKPRK